MAARTLELYVGHSGDADARQQDHQRELDLGRRRDAVEVEVDRQRHGDDHELRDLIESYAVVRQTEIHEADGREACAGDLEFFNLWHVDSGFAEEAAGREQLVEEDCEHKVKAGQGHGVGEAGGKDPLVEQDQSDRGDHVADRVRGR